LAVDSSVRTAEVATHYRFAEPTGDVDDIAGGFIATEYDRQSFFVRHAYFLYDGKDTRTASTTS
jgi:hypothetical protein